MTCRAKLLDCGGSTPLCRTTEVLLFDPDRPGNTWRLTDAVQFEFPSGQRLAPGALAIVCAVEPSLFRVSHGVPAEVEVYGPWTGALNNAGDSIELRRPGEPEPDGTVPYYRVDRVAYEPFAPWPEAANAGDISLDRVSLQAYGNDPASWQPSVRGGTPGVLTQTENRPPVLQPVPDQLYPAQTRFELDLSATDPDLPPQALRFAASDLPPGLELDPLTGRITGIATSPGAHNVTVTVTDDRVPPGSDNRSFAFTVMEPFALRTQLVAPGQPPQFLFESIEGETYEVHYSDRLYPTSWQLLERFESAAGGLLPVPALPPGETSHHFLRVLWIRNGDP